MKKSLGLGILVIILLTLILPVLAEPNWGSTESWTSEPWLSFKHTPSGLRIVKDPLVVASSLPTPAPGNPPDAPTTAPTISGWVIFVCSDDKEPFTAPEGFDYSVTAKGLSPGVSYNVRAYPQLGSADYGTVDFYNLGTLIADSQGEGEVSGFIDLVPGPFIYQITVELSDGTVILSMLPAFTYWNPDLDATLPFPPDDPMTLGELLWFTGDLADGFVVE